MRLTILTLLLALAGCATQRSEIVKARPIDSAAPAPTLTVLSKKSPREAFPQRTDLAFGDALKMQPFRPVAPIFQPPAVIPTDATPGNYEMHLTFIIESDGTVREAVIAKSSGAARIDDAALAMIRSWRFSPCISGGKPVAVGTEMPVYINIEAESDLTQPSARAP